MTAYVLTESIVATSILTVSFQYVRAASASKESTFETTGIRPILPVLIYATGCKLPVDIEAIPNNTSFLVAADFAGTFGDPFYDNGAAPNYIGTKVVPAVGPASIAFRPPEPNEVVWVVSDMSQPGGTLYRYQQTPLTNGPSGPAGGDWFWNAAYRSLPERFLIGMQVFDILDPDQIYAYYARLLGAMYYEMQYDNGVILNQFDADLCSHFYLPLLAAQYGLQLDAALSLTQQRSMTRNAVQAYKLKGTPKSVAIRLLDLGYIGFAQEIWIDPGDPTCQLVNNADGKAGNVPMSTATTAEVPVISTFGMSGGNSVLAATGYISFQLYQSPASGDTVTISDGVLTKTFQFGVAIGPNILVPSAADPHALMVNLITVINSSGLALTATDITIDTTSGPPIGDQPTSSNPHGTLVVGVSDADYAEYPHGYWSQLIGRWVPSSRLAVHINYLSGAPVYFDDSPSGKAAALAIQTAIADNLSFDVLPAAVDIRFFDTDFQVANEPITVSDALTISHV